MNTGGAESLQGIAADLAETQRELSGLAGELRRRAAAMQPASGQDPEGAVTVHLDAEGGFDRVSLGEDWREDVGVDGLGPAVAQASQQAATARMQQWSDESIERPEGEDAAPQPAPMSFRLGDPTSTEARASLDQLRELAATAESQLEGFAAAIKAAQNTETAGSSPDRSVRVVISANIVSKVEIDRRWAENASDGLIERTIADALRSASPERNPADAREQAWSGFPELAAVRELAHNPEDLMRRLGVIR
ncbi:hypothetical protein [Homoserinibacter sp. YIM 151385]|uniref:hypothetical protein n=1 Tax=Homoserinibacter sp. YIM 151385 TaxID=2985506 RepID=UPI0022F0EE00|nr:hypothetical protein [Homoserinibacter sp. YIM 151385]WBU38694.1 hypothetical protein OF852_03665 [Homoserinibacter sp. YIM 151385]